MSDLGVMVSASCALYEMELSLEHVAVEGRDDAVTVRWGARSSTLIEWSNAGQDVVTFTTTMAFPDDLPVESRGVFAEALANMTAESGSGLLEHTQLADSGDLVVAMRAVIEDASYSGEVADAYIGAMTEVMTLDGALAEYARGSLQPDELAGYLRERRMFSA